jgi:multidrug efflux pump subunit AcrA (membrane-fusion protein)
LARNEIRAVTTCSCVGRSAPLVLAGRIALLLVAAAVAVSAFVLAGRPDRGTVASATRYVCPMHPEVLSRAPGECPICRMALVETSRSDAAGPHVHPHPVTDVARRQRVAGRLRVPAWFEEAGRVVAVLYEDDRQSIARGARGRFFRAASPRVSTEVRLSDEPVVPRDVSTSWVRFRLAGSGPPPEPGEIGWIELAERARDSLVVPAGAVLSSARGSYALVVAGDGRIAERPIEIGRIVGSSAAVLSGLHEGETVVVGNVFFWNAEHRLQSDRGEEGP